MVESVKQEQSLQAPPTRISMKIGKNFEEVKTVEKKKVLLARRGKEEVDISKDDQKSNESYTSSECEEEKVDNLSDIAKFIANLRSNGSIPVQSLISEKLNETASFGYSSKDKSTKIATEPPI